MIALVLLLPCLCSGQVNRNISYIDQGIQAWEAQNYEAAVFSFENALLLAQNPVVAKKYLAGSLLYRAETYLNRNDLRSFCSDILRLQEIMPDDIKVKELVSLCGDPTQSMLNQKSFNPVIDNNKVSLALKALQDRQRAVIAYKESSLNLWLWAGVALGVLVVLALAWLVWTFRRGILGWLPKFSRSGGEPVTFAFKSTETEFYKIPGLDKAFESLVGQLNRLSKQFSELQFEESQKWQNLKEWNEAANLHLDNLWRQTMSQSNQQADKMNHTVQLGIEEREKSMQTVTLSMEHVNGTVEKQLALLREELKRVQDKFLETQNLRILENGELKKQMSDGQQRFASDIQKIVEQNALREEKYEKSLKDKENELWNLQESLSAGNNRHVQALEGLEEKINQMQNQQAGELKNLIERYDQTQFKQMEQDRDWQKVLGEEVRKLTETVSSGTTSQGGVLEQVRFFQAQLAEELRRFAEKFDQSVGKEVEADAKREKDLRAELKRIADSVAASGSSQVASLELLRQQHGQQIEELKGLVLRYEQNLAKQMVADDTLHANLKDEFNGINQRIQAAAENHSSVVEQLRQAEMQYADGLKRFIERYDETLGRQVDTEMRRDKELKAEFKKVLESLGAGGASQIALVEQVREVQNQQIEEVRKLREEYLSVQNDLSAGVQKLSEEIKSLYQGEGNRVVALLESLKITGEENFNILSEAAKDLKANSQQDFKTISEGLGKTEAFFKVESLGLMEKMLKGMLDQQKEIMDKHEQEFRRLTSYFNQASLKWQEVIRKNEEYWNKISATRVRPTLTLKKKAEEE